MRKIVIWFVFLGIFLIFMSGYADADFGVASRYYAGRPLEMRPGEVVDTYFKIQNTIGETKDITVEASITRGSEIATFADGKTTYDVLAGEQVLVNFRVEIPEGVAIGTEYTIAVLFKEVSPEVDDGQVQFVVNVEREFRVFVVGEPEDSEEPDAGSPVLLWVSGILIILSAVVIMILIFVLKRMKKESSSIISHQLLTAR